MTLPQHIADREHRKFIEDADGEPSVRIGPNAIQDSDGNKLALDKYGRAKFEDVHAISMLKNIHTLLQDILEQLKIISDG